MTGMAAARRITAKIRIFQLKIQLAGSSPRSISPGTSWQGVGRRSARVFRALRVELLL